MYVCVIKGLNSHPQPPSEQFKPKAKVKKVSRPFLFSFFHYYIHLNIYFYYVHFIAVYPYSVVKKYVNKTNILYMLYPNSLTLICFV